MINFRKATLKDYKIALIPAIIVAAFSELMFLWNFADTVRMTIEMFGNIPNFSAEGAANTLYIHLCLTVDSFCLVLAYAFGIAILYSIKKTAAPFTAFVGKGMRAIAVSEIIPYIFILASKRIIAAAVTAPTEEYRGYFGIASVFVMLLLFIISFVFDYGCELQKESDETI